MALDAVQQRLDQVDTQLAVVAATATATARQLSDAGNAADVLNLDMAAAAGSAANLSGALADATQRAGRLSASMTLTAQRAGDLRTSLAGVSAAAQSAANRLNDLSDAAVKAAAASAAATAVGRVGIGVWGLWGLGLLNARNGLNLWGGLLTGILPKFLTFVSYWHLAADTVLEFAAVWGPAIIAVTAFSVAASDAVNNVVRQLTNMHTVADATGQSFGPLSGNLEALHQAVQPQVYQIFGDALTVAAARGSALNTVIMQTGKVLDDLAARAALAIQSASAGTFLKNAVSDVRLLGTAFGNLFGLLGNLIRMNAGWAGVLLQAGTAVLGLAEHVTSLIIPLGQLLVLGHGFVLWVGLAVTAAVKLGPIILGWGKSFLQAAVGVAWMAQKFVDLAKAEGIMAALADVNPFVWVGIAVGALAGLVLWLHNSTSAAQQYANAVTQAAQNSATLTGAISVLQIGVAQSANSQAAAQANLAAVTAKTAGASDSFNKSQIQSQMQVAAATGQVTAATNAHAQLSGQLGTVSTRLTSLSATYGSTGNALALLSAAGITNTQMMDKSAGTWALIRQEVQATYQAYQAMGNQAGILGNDLAVLNKQATDQYAAIQKLNSAWDTQTAAVTATQGSFDTAAQGYTTLASSAGTFTLRLGVLSTSVTKTKAAIDSLSPSGIALNQAFSQQVGNLNTMADSWRTAAWPSSSSSAGWPPGSPRSRSTPPGPPRPPPSSSASRRKPATRDPTRCRP